ncbi:MAG: 4Fe-4S dicluster domain-containing protein [Myxococcales bacterium]|nr:4Fe-4S dicluster domain-containing protein [Myxococcales bacterium]
MNGSAITREILGNIPAGLVAAFYALAFGACGWAAWVLLRRSSTRHRGRRPAQSPPPLGERLVSIARYLVFQEPLRRDRFAGIAHLLVTYGFLILFVGTSIVFLEHQTPLHFFYGWFYRVASLVIDLGGLAFITGLLMFLWRRHFAGEGRILRAWWVAALTWLLLAISISGFLLEGARIAVELPDFERWSAVGYSIALALHAADVSAETLQVWHRALWGGHALVCVLFFALVPWLFFAHMIYGAASWSLRRRRPLAQLRSPASPELPPGAATVRALDWNDLLQVDACTTCGLCNMVCPAAAAGTPLRPREIVLGIREALTDFGSTADGDDLPGRFDSDALWSCTTCGACNEVCPVGIDVYDKIVELRRACVEAGSVPDSAADFFEATANAFNPFGRDNDQRLAWAQGLNPPVAEPGEEIDLLYWVGCAGSFDPDGQSVSRSMIAILDRLGIRYRILGCRERCTGDPARRAGEEGLFRQCARENIETLAGHSVKTVLTHCPHCFNTMKNEYPEFGASFSVEHHSQFLARMIAEGRLAGMEGLASVTFHDPCYLGRGNGETAAPRAVIDAMSDARVEMPRHGKESFCCGAGGGGLWLDVPGKDRVENIRSREAASTGAKIVATGCPFCKIMLEAGNQALPDGNSMVVKDLAELVAERMPRSGAAS